MRTFLRILKWVVAVLAVVGGIVYALFDPWRVPSDDPQFGVSIEPTVSSGDLVLVSRFSGASEGALVRCPDPDAPGRWVVGRVMATGGDTIHIAGGSVQVNGKSPDSPYGCDGITVTNPATEEQVDLACSTEEVGGIAHPAVRATASQDREVTAQVEDGKVYLVSDDRSLHLDSRDFGAISPAGCHRIAYRLVGAAGWGDAKRRLTFVW